MKTMEPKKVEITREQLSDLVRSFPPARNDVRVEILRDLVGEYEQYTHKLEWMARNLAEDVEKNRSRGIASVYETIGSSSLWQEVPMHAAKITALIRALEATCRAKDDPTSTPIDELIRTLDWRR